MNLLYGLLIFKVLNPKKAKTNIRTIEKEVRFVIKLITEIVDTINIVIEFIVTKTRVLVKNYLRKQVAVEKTIYKNVINLNEYKLKKAK